MPRAERFIFYRRTRFLSTVFQKNYFLFSAQILDPASFPCFPLFLPVHL